MYIANLKGRLVLLSEHGSIDVERASNGRFGPDPAGIYLVWDEFYGWATDAAGSADWEDYDPAMLEAPSPRPRQVFAVGLNYAPHVDEAGFVLPEAPVVFTKFPSCICGPYGDLELPSGNVDWEVELVVVVGRPGYRVPRSDAWRYIAGLTVGQDYSERVVQSRGTAPQFSIGKSFPGFGPTGPWLSTLEEFDDPDDIELRCEINGRTVQHGRTAELIFPIPVLVEWLSDKCRLFPGDLIFTGTPGGTGAGRTPPAYLQPGDEVVSTITGIGAMRNRCVALR
jgi:2-keto-4-pentenoate hydratase/2-oxohepta-3-ene-1,7-dioic acid hydratase in catechol pathway